MALGESYIDVLLKIPKDKRSGELAKIRAQASNYDVNANEVAVDLERSEGSTTFRSLMRNLVGQMNAVPRSLRVRREAGENVGNLYPILSIHFNGTKDFIIKEFKIYNETIYGVLRRLKKLSGYNIYSVSYTHLTLPTKRIV